MNKNRLTVSQQQQKRGGRSVEAEKVQRSPVLSRGEIRNARPVSGHLLNSHQGIYQRESPKKESGGN